MKKTSSHASHTHLTHFAVLIVLIFLGVAAIQQSAHQPVKQMVAFWLLSLGYICWGVWHHSRHGTLYWHIIIEYVLLAVLALALSTTIIIN